MSRSYAADDGSIAGRIKQLADERMAVIAGCNCEPDPYSGVTNHAAACPLWPGLPPATPPGCNTVMITSGHNITFHGVRLKAEAIKILADHRCAVADWVDSHVRHKLWTGPEEYTKGMGGCAVDCPHPDHGDTVIDWTHTASSGA